MICEKNELVNAKEKQHLGMNYGKKNRAGKNKHAKSMFRKKHDKNICTHNEFMEILTSVGEKNVAALEKQQDPTLLKKSSGKKTISLEQHDGKSLKSSGAGKNWQNTVLGKNILEKH